MYIIMNVHLDVILVYIVDSSILDRENVGTHGYQIASCYIRLHVILAQQK